MQSFSANHSFSVHASLSALSPFGHCSLCWPVTDPTPFPKNNKCNPLHSPLALIFYFFLLCNAWPPFFSSLTTSLPTPSSTPIPDPNTHPASPPPKQQPADTEQGRRTSLEKFTRSVVSHVELGAVHITNHTGWLTISGFFAVITMLHSVVDFLNL